MPTYDSVTTRADVQSMIREQVSDIMLSRDSSPSAVLSLFRRINVPTNETRFPVLDTLPQAYWVDGDTGLKQTSSVSWDDRYLQIEKLAVILPVPDSVIDDTSFDIWGYTRPLVEDAIYRKIDSAVFFGTDAPGSFPTAIAAAATAAGNEYFRGTNNAAAGGIAEDVNQTMGKLLDDGYATTAFVANPAYQTRLRSARGTDGQLLTDINGGNRSIWGLPAIYPMAGLWPATGDSDAELFAMQRENFIVGVRGDFEVTISNQAVLQNGSGQVTHNAFQQDMTFYRIVFRMGWQVSNPLNYTQQTEASRYPAAILRSPNT